MIPVEKIFPEGLTSTKDSRFIIGHWILEIHLVDQARQFGGFYDELLTM
jgi:hypothetical protein